MELDTGESEVLTFRMLGLLEAMDTASKHMNDPKDVLLMDLDTDSLWKVIPEEQMEKLEKGFKLG